jgi:glucosamine 6-phosphate synthetase-like amidotransferase/phosphosugar isomerase protein
MMRILVLVLAMLSAAEVAAQTTLPDRSELNSARLADRLNLELGGDIAAMPRKAYEAQQAQLRMIPGYLDRATELERTIATLREDLARHKQALAELLAENESLRLELARNSSAKPEATP